MQMNFHFFSPIMNAFQCSLATFVQNRQKRSTEDVEKPQRSSGTKKCKNQKHECIGCLVTWLNAIEPFWPTKIIYFLNP
jgi:hypothetical protein